MVQTAGGDPIPGGPVAAGIAELKGSDADHFRPRPPVVAKRSYDVVGSICLVNRRIPFPVVRIVVQIVTGLAEKHTYARSPPG